MQIKGMTINEGVYKLANGANAKIAVFIYSGEGDPAKHLEQAVLHYVEHNGHHELIDANLDNPWMRVILSDINNMKQEPYDSDTHKLTKNL